MKLVKLCGVNEIEDGSVRGFDIEGKHIILVKQNGMFFSLDGICTHAHADMADGFLSDGSITCSLHLSVFDLKTGNPTNPPARLPLKTYKVKVEGGNVFVEL